MRRYHVVLLLLWVELSYSKARTIPKRPRAAEKESMTNFLSSQHKLHAPMTDLPLELASLGTQVYTADGGWFGNIKSHKGVILLSSVVFAVVVYLIVRAIEKAVEVYIESVERELLGVEASIGKMWVNPITWTIHFDGFSLGNPPHYQTRHLLKAERLTLDFDMFRLFMSCFTEIRIKCVQMSDIRVNFEQQFTIGKHKSCDCSSLQQCCASLCALKDSNLTSNLQDVQHYLFYGSLAGTEELPPSGRTYALEQVNLSNIQIQVIIVGGANVAMEPFNIIYDNFEKDQAVKPAPNFNEVVTEAAQKILEKLLVSVRGK